MAITIRAAFDFKRVYTTLPPGSTLHFLDGIHVTWMDDQKVTIEEKDYEVIHRSYHPADTFCIRREMPLT